MSAAGDFSEDTLVEQPAIELFADLGWETQNCFREQVGKQNPLGRESRSDVVLVPRLRAALVTLNPGLPREAIEGAIEELTRDRSTLAAAHANREVYRLLKDGVKVSFRNDEDEETLETVQVIDWRNPEANDFFLTSQLWILGEMYTRRADLVGFVNGLPLVFIELKAVHKSLEDAYRKNLRDYKATIPQLFWYNALIILSNGSTSRIGSMTASWEHFSDWKKINSEGETGIISLETIIRGTCDKSRLLDLVENFTLFSDAGGALVKLVAKNHQYLGVNNAIQAVTRTDENKGRLGVFWHTQGSGKSYSMVFFAQKILRTLPGNWTFLVVTDREELDEQIYKTFASAGAITEGEVQAESGRHLQQLLQEDHRAIFTLIQKFRTEQGESYPVLSTRSDIIVMTDEAHRSQYDLFALNMRTALPNASFIGFTGTPLLVGEEKTKEVFGDYVSIYNFRQSIDDAATVPLYYENRLPELQLTNEHFDEEMLAVIESADLNDEQEKKLDRLLRREYHLITREERLESIARDIVAHFMGRGQMGKAMIISIDKATALRMYDKVRKYWADYLTGLKDTLRAGAGSADEREALVAKIAFMEATDMAVVVSQAQNEVEDFKKKGLDITPHRKRLVTEDLDTKFKDPQDPLRIVFVCAMWMTGFDVPSVSTIYLDKPMRNHTLMQTIARANRVFEGKTSGLIVDYVGVFRDLQKALTIYASGGSDTEPGNTPIQDKSVVVAALRKALLDMEELCARLGFTADAIGASQKLERVRLLDDAVEAILVNEETKRRYLTLTRDILRLYKAILPDAAANEFGRVTTLYAVLATMLQTDTAEVDISAVLEAIDTLLDRSIAPEGYVIAEGHAPNETTGRLIDLNKIDFKALQTRFAQGHKRTEAEKLKGALNSKLKQMVRLNKSRTGYLDLFQKMIDEYNNGALSVEMFFAKLVTLAQDLTAEEQRLVAEHLTEEELAVFDLLTKPDPDLSDGEKEAVKKVARELLETLKREKLVLDWRKRQQARAQVRTTIERLLDADLPEAYTPELYEKKCDLVYQHVFEAYTGQGKSIYGSAA